MKAAPGLFHRGLNPMFFKKRVIADAEQFSLNSAPTVLRFFQMFVGDQAAAEALTIDTLAEHIHGSGTSSNPDARIPLLRRALQKAVAAHVLPSRITDPVIRAVTQLEPRRRAVIVLFRGLSLDMATIGEITGLDQGQLRRLCFDALEELRTLLNPARPAVPPSQFREAR